MDDNAKHASSYQHDQEILDARGINMTVEEVAGLTTCKYSERVQTLNLNEDDLLFLKGLRRRIRNRLASQNSRRRSMENLRRLTRELRAVRACRDDTLAERRALLAARAALRRRCAELRAHIVRILEDRSDTAEVPDLEPERTPIESPRPEMPLKSQVFECRIDKLVQQSVNHLYKERDRMERDKMKMDQSANDKCKMDQHVYIMDQHGNDVCKMDQSPNDKCKMDQHVYIMDQHGNDVCKMEQRSVYRLDQSDCRGKRQERVCAKTVFIGSGEEVLNLSKKKSHGRKQSAPRRITYVFTEPDEDAVLDLKIKKEPQ